MSIGSRLRLSQGTTAVPAEKEVIKRKDELPQEIAQLLKFTVKDESTTKQRRLQSAQLKLSRPQTNLLERTTNLLVDNSS